MALLSSRKGGREAKVQACSELLQRCEVSEAQRHGTSREPQGNRGHRGLPISSSPLQHVL